MSSSKTTRPETARSEASPDPFSMVRGDPLCASAPLPSIDVISAFRFHMFALAHELQAYGCLNRLYTTMPQSMVPEVTSRSISSRPWLTPAHRLVATLPARGPRLANRLLIADFDRWVSRKLRGSRVV